jgi:hypothetical protein
MKALLTAALLSLPALALAAPAAPSAARAAPDPAREAKMEKDLHTLRTIGLAQALDLDASQAMQLDASMAPFDQRRKAAHDQLKASKEILERAADGDPAAGKQVDQALQQAFDARSQIEQVDRDMLTTVGKSMSPQQKAKLSLFLAHFKKDMMARFAQHQGRAGRHGGFEGR